MNRMTKEVAEQKARDFVLTFASKQECWDYLESLGVAWRKSKDAKINDKRAMKALIGEYLYGLDPSLAKTTGHYMSKARMERFTSYEGDFKFFKTKEELEEYYSEKYPDRKIVWKD